MIIQRKWLGMGIFIIQECEEWEIMEWKLGLLEPQAGIQFIFWTNIFLLHNQLGHGWPSESVGEKVIVLGGGGWWFSC